ncbi:MAG: hypothetical protein K2R98_05305 [Gemmataceae bacterium]|nr:hypothetical protein [Gemmataceae bacterium]
MKTAKTKTAKPKKLKTAKAKKQSPKLHIQFAPEGGYTSTFHHSDGRKTVKVCPPQGAPAKAKPNFERNYNQQCNNLGWFLRTVAQVDPDAELSDILMDVECWPAILEAMLEDHGENATLADFDLE